MPTKTMTQSHKEALAVGRERGRAVKNYLEAIDSRSKTKRGPGRPVDPAKAKEHLADVLSQLETCTDPMKRLLLTGRKLNLEAKLSEEVGTDEDLAELEAEFIKHAKAYGEAKGIEPKAWRQVGVSAKVLREAGIP